MVEGWEPGQNLMFELTYSKVRHAASFQSQTVALEAGKFVIRQSVLAREIMRLIHEGKTHRQVSQELGVSIGLVSKVRQRADRTGLTALNAKAAVTGAST
jgi:hypothetical protein